MLKIGSLGKKIIYKQKFNYLSPIDKPIMPLSLTSLSQFSAQLMQMASIDSGGIICPQVSVVMGAMMFRLLSEGVCTIIRGYRFKGEAKNIDYVETKDVSELRPVLRWIHKALIVDSVRDYQFYGLKSVEINKMIGLYLRPGVLLANFVNVIVFIFQCYLALNFMRGANYLISEPQFAVFCNSTSYLPSLSLYDPIFITPMIGILCSFWILKGSRHPLLIHYVHPQNIFHCFNLAFMSGLLLVPVGGIYHFAYFGLALGHLGIRGIRYGLRDTNYSMKKLLRLNK